MKTKSITLIIFLTTLAVAGGIVLNRPPSGAIHDTVHKDIYFCPMHPKYTSDHPGNCPICGMTLVKKEKHVHPAEESQESTSSEYSIVSITPQKQQLMGIKTAPVAKQTLTKTIHAYGYVAHDLELYDAQLEYIDAWRIYYAFLSRRPVKDEFRTDWREYYLKAPAEGRWRSDEKVKALQRLVKAEYELRHMGITDEQLDQLKEIKYGQPWVQPDLLFFEKGHPFWIYAQVPEIDLGFIAPTQKVIATIPAYGEKVEGIIRSIAPVVDSATRTARVRIELSDYKGELSVNMFVNVDVPVELDTAVVVPREAIMDTGLRKIIFVQAREGVFEPREIETGFEGNGMVAVKSGISEGEIIVISGNFLLDSESRLHASLMGGGHQHD